MLAPSMMTRGQSLDPPHGRRGRAPKSLPLIFTHPLWRVHIHVNTIKINFKIAI